MIPESWEVVRMDQILDKIIDYRGKTPKKSSSGIRTLSAKSIKHGRIDYDHTYFISAETYRKWERRGTPEVGDVLLTTEGPLGELAQLDNRNVAIAQRLLTLRGKEGELDNSYLKYALMSSLGQNELLSRATGTTVQGIKQSEFRKVLIAKPPFEEQVVIAKILSGLDSKIDLNDRMSNTLEGIGRALFKHWFIDFEFLNDEGNCYSSSGGEMVFNEELEKDIPKGWRVGDILDCAKVLSGGTPRTDVPEYWGGGIPWVSAKDVTNSQGSFIIDTERTITQLGMDDSNTKLLPKYTTIVTARGVVGSYCILSREMAINQTNYGLKAKSGWGDFFVFFSISNLVNQMKQHSYGTIFDTITTNTFHDMRLPIPPNLLVKSFEEREEALMDKSLANRQESRSLADVHDALLPKLMSGRIRVPYGDG
jgi:type I restriction enzyme S subunit